MTVMSAREFNQSVAAAQRAAESAPVVITRRGRPAFVLMSIAEFDRLRGGRNDQPLTARLAPSGGVDLEAGDFTRDTDRGRDLENI